MRNKSVEVNARILLLTKLWLDGVYGVITGDQVALLAGCSKPLVDAARIVLESGDKALVESDAERYKARQTAQRCTQGAKAPETP